MTDELLSVDAALILSKAECDIFKIGVLLIICWSPGEGGIGKLVFDLRIFFYEVTRVKPESKVWLVDREDFILLGAGDLPARESSPEDDDMYG